MHEPTPPAAGPAPEPETPCRADHEAITGATAGRSEPAEPPVSPPPGPGRWAWWVLGGLLLAGAAWLALMAALAPHAGPGRLSAARGAGAAAGTALLALTGLLVLARVRDAALAAWVLADAGALITLLLGAMQVHARLNLLGPGSLFAGVLAATLAVSRAGAGPMRGPGWATVAQGLYVAGLGWIGLSLGRPLPARAWIALALAGLAAGLAARLTTRGADAAEPLLWRRLAQLSPRGRALLVALAAFAAYAAAAGPRLGRPSANNHFVYLAKSYLSGRLSLSAEQLRRKRRLHQYDDWARVDRVRLLRPLQLSSGRTLAAGTVLRGTWLLQNRRHTDRFRTTRGQVVRLVRGTYRADGADWYVSFPPGPALLMLPGVALWGYGFNDVWFTVVLASISPALLLLFLGRMRRAGLSHRTVQDDLWLTLLFALGSVVYFVSVRGEVWFTAHVVGILLLLLYLHASLEARFPMLAGLALGLATASRVTLLLAAPLFLWELWRSHARPPEPGAHADPAAPADPSRHATATATRSPIAWRGLAAGLLRFSLPLLLVGAALAAHNWARFDSPFEFGHRYLDVVWRERIQRWGLFDMHYLPRNLAAAFVLLPHLQPDPPYLLVSRHGLSLLLVSPALLLVLWPRRRGPWHRPLWLATGSMLGLVLLYQNTGFVQFSYRFSADFTPLLVLLIAAGGRPLTQSVKVLILWGVLWNLLGAASFGLAPDLYGRTNWIWTPLDPGCRC